MKQLLENTVRVKFWTVNNPVPRVKWYNLVIDEERRQMGKDCGAHQSDKVGNRVESEVMTIRRSGD